VITISTSMGDIVVELFEESAPVSCRNFRQYAESGFFDDTIFHRVIPDFMIQGGGFTADMSQKRTREPIRNEADNGEKNLRGTLAMARTQVVDSATSQFFINLRDNSFLDHGGRDFGYAVFGKVTGGMEVVDAIAGVPTGSAGGHADVPVEPVRIGSVRAGD
jgi:cyclophilin family peptidyl-prolyl cis-trans isomerase